MPLFSPRRRALCMFLLAGSLCGSLPATAAMPTEQSLDGAWQFRLATGDAQAGTHAGATRWLPGQVPGTVQGDLLRARLVPDPYQRDNEAAIQWVGLADWDYQRHFTLDAATLARGQLQLQFDGLDTFAAVELNGHPLGQADNMFRRWRYDVKPYLHAGDNTLVVHLYSPIKRLQPWLARQPYALPGEFDSAFGDEPVGRQSANYLRKAQYGYGWDWGPRIVTEGIWQPVRLLAWDDARLEDLHIDQQRVDAQVAQVQTEVALNATRQQPVQLELSVLDPQGHEVDHQSRQAVLDPGRNTLNLPSRIAQPQRWWPAGYGAPAMYTFKLSVSGEHGLIYQGEQRTGLRSIELRRQADAWGRSFAFVINGVPIFAKGADVIPFDSLPPRATDAQMRQVLQSAHDANMNMLRIWGGGYYLPDSFYAMADQLGLMIWQDFMFGGAVPPYDVAYRENTRQEAIEQVRRLRDHPAIVLWAGNNEVQTGWESWGDRLALKKAVSADERERIERGMLNLFGSVLRDVVSRYAPQVPYWSSSPSTDFDGAANLLDDGDNHYWNVWSGDAKPVEEYLKVTPRFASEYGLQSFPELRTIEAFTRPADRDPESTVLRAHQKYDKGNGNQRLLLYIRRSFGEPKDFASFVYLSQVMQAEGIELAAEHLRAARPQTMGSLYWQLNDVWPGASWSSIDYYGRWKALQYHARRFYAPLLIAALRQQGQTTVSLVSDRTEALPAHWRLRLLDFDGTERYRSEGDTTLAPLASSALARYSDAELLRGADPHHSVAVFELLVDGQVASCQLVFFAPAKQLALPAAAIHSELQPAADGKGYQLTLTSPVLAREVWLSFGGLDATPSDNAFDLLPGEPLRLHVDSAASALQLRAALQLRDLAGTLAGAPAEPAGASR